MLVESELGSLERLWASRFKALRLDRGLSLSDLANAVGVSVDELGAFETGESQIAASDLWKISCVLDVPIDELIGAATPPQTKRIRRLRLH